MKKIIFIYIIFEFGGAHSPDTLIYYYILGYHYIYGNINITIVLKYLERHIVSYATEVIHDSSI